MSSTATKQGRPSGTVIVHGHWSKMFEGFQTSTLDYYAALEQALAARAIPGLRVRRADFHEGGVGTARREYLRVVRERLTFDICGAPFGTGFFFSWWLTEKPSPRGALYTALLLGAIGYAGSEVINMLGLIEGALAFTAGVPIALLTLGLVVREQYPEAEGEVLAMPFFGALYARILRPATYYRTDTVLMFKAVVHNAVLETIERLTVAKGIRGLSDEEKKPIMRDFFGR